ncbi:hypothetical protein [Pelagibacterium luteolum]|uniref:DUF2188 domain-containing protein n=1 Tax=Pelagibacterium luteolum TaxID=440168 RepID=A0A1G7XUR9_9HYPH|nr:hypothetical protein [Pelagibacterium luteolum]SDG87901.1 hypothetical protein SAMN04487974_1119 [Pelagibacterium luteolum]
MSNDNQKVQVVVQSDDKGHWVLWDHDGNPGVLGPYEDVAMAEHVRAAKERELAENEQNISEL